MERAMTILTKLIASSILVATVVGASLPADAAKQCPKDNPACSSGATTTANPNYPQDRTWSGTFDSGAGGGGGGGGGGGR
jgi:hypothetical protein